jgi:hypothetical protein
MKSSLTQSLFMVCFLLIDLSPCAYAFDYLEHLYFTDEACVRTQKQFRQILENTEMSEQAQQQLMIQYLALSLYCPMSWDQPYCHQGLKGVESAMSKALESPRESGDYSMTLGDISAFADHNARLGPLQKLTPKDEEGLVYDVVDYLTHHNGELRTTLEDIAEDACEVGDLADFGALKQDLNQTTIELKEIHSDYFNAFLRDKPTKGPSDPAGVFSFDNPHYLDLVFRNHNHFGVNAFESWSGLHYYSKQMNHLKCEQLLPDNEDLYDELLGLLPKDAIDFDEMDQDLKIKSICDHLKAHLLIQIKKWLSHADDELKSFIFKNPKLKRSKIKTWIDEIEKFPAFSILLKAPQKQLPISIFEQYQDAFDALSASWLSLILQGTALHFLQDILAGGHLRTIRTRGGLKENRFDHDFDNENGVIAVFHAKKGKKRFVAFGDTYLLGKQSPQFINCQLLTNQPNQSVHQAQSMPNSALITKCLIAYQRSLLLAVTQASLMDWGQSSIEASHFSKTDYQNWIDEFLPIQRTTVIGEEEASVSMGREVNHGQVNHGQANPQAIGGNIPIPPPPFKYESLSNRWGFDLRGKSPQLNLQLSFFEELGRFAHWGTSFQWGIFTNIGDHERRQYSSEFGYHFHFRFSARFLINLGMAGYLGFKGLDSDVAYFMGMSPTTSITLLPEGWIKMPLEINIAYRLPLTFFDSEIGFPGSRLIEGHYLYLGLGLAVMN